MVHVGLHRTASTWLQIRYFPAVGSVFNNFRAPWADPLINPLVKGGTIPEVPPNCIISAERLSGHPLGGWHDADDIADRIQRTMPDARLLVGYRDPDGLARSIHEMLIAHGETRTLEDLLTPDWWRPHMDLSKVSLSALRERYKSRFDEVLFLPLERLKLEPTRYIGELSDFLGVSTPAVDPSPVGSWSSLNVNRARVANHFRHMPLNRSPLVDLGGLFQFAKKVNAKLSYRWNRN